MAIVELGPDFNRKWRNDLNNNIKEIANGTTEANQKASEALEALKQPIGTDKLENEAVTNEKIADDAVNNTQLASKSVNFTKIDDKSIDLNNMNAPVAFVTPSKNLIDKTKLITGIYVSAVSGRENPNPDYSATEFINAKGNRNYVLTPGDQVAFFDKNKKFISGIGGVSDYKTFVTPEDTAFIRCSVANYRISKLQLEEGKYATKKELYKPPTPIETLLKTDKLTDLLHHIENPFVKTELDIIGDSISAGVGGTGYSKTGELMFIDSAGVEQRANVETAVCWANMLKKYLEEKYNKIYQVDLSFPGIEIFSYDCEFRQYDSTRGTGYQWYFPNRQAGCTMMKFKFYGSAFSVLTSKSSGVGAFEVYVDNVLVKTVDCYNETFMDYVPTEITGLSESYHEVKFVETNAKNFNSIGYGLYIQGLLIPKKVIVKNRGISGRQSRQLTYDKEKWVRAEADFVLLQLGTNDRQREPYGYTQEHQRNFINYVRGLGKKIIMMASIPASTKSETSYPYFWHMEDINNRLVSLAHEMNVPFINNYLFFIDYLMYTEKDIDTLLADGLHPNDKGYELMFKNIMKHLGFGYKVW